MLFVYMVFRNTGRCGKHTYGFEKMDVQNPDLEKQNEQATTISESCIYTCLQSAFLFGIYSTLGLEYFSWVV